MTAPCVLIAMATGILGGPGKGLVQFLRHGGLEGCRPITIDYHRGFEQGETDFARAIRESGAPLFSLRQCRTFDPGLVDQALVLIREHGVNLLQSHGYKSHVLCWMLRRKTGLPWLAFVHGWTRENLRVRLYTGLEHILLPAADEVVAVSESLRARLLPPVRKRCRVIPNALATEELKTNRSRAEIRSSLGFPEDAIVAGIVGRLSPEKGHSIFLRALAAARQKDARLMALIVGDGQERQRLEKEAAALGLAPVCVFTGHVRETAACYKAMDMQILASSTEGMPNVILEGMHMSLPVIATKVGGVPEVVEEKRTALLVNYGDEKALVRAILTLAASSETRAAMGAAGAERIQREFDPHIRANRILELYQTILDASEQKGRLQ